MGKAISYDETGFLGRDDALYRRQAWNFMLSGGSVFDGLDYSFSVGHEDGTDTMPNGPGGGSPALRRQLRVLSEFLQKLPLEDLAPDTRTVKHAAGVFARAVSSRSGEYGVYFDGHGPTDITLELPAGEYVGRVDRRRNRQRRAARDASATRVARRCCARPISAKEWPCG